MIDYDKRTQEPEGKGAVVLGILIIFALIIITLIIVI